MVCCLTDKKCKDAGKRIEEIDFLRGIAILMMAVFHFTWDLDYFGLTSADLLHGFWKIFQVLTGGLFIFLVGVSLTLKYSKPGHGGYPKEFLKRGLFIFGCGMIITIGSLLFAKDYFVFFGILHFIGLSIILATPFIGSGCLNLLIGVVSILFGIWLQGQIFSFPWLVWLGFNHPVSTLDLYPLFPWVGLVFLGMFLGSMVYPHGKRIATIKTRFCPLIKRISQPVRLLGRYSLLIYFIHIPIVFLIAYVISLLA